MRIRGKRPPASMDHCVSLSSSSPSPSPSSSASSSSSITAAHSPLASSQDSSNSGHFSLFATTTHRCHGLDLLVKAIHQVTAGSVIGVPYIQRRVTIRRRRRSPCIVFELFEKNIRQENEKNSSNNKKKLKKGKKTSVAKKRQKRAIGLPSKFQDSVLQPWGRRSESEMGL